MLENIDTSQPIPPEWRVRGADSHLHSIGLSLFKPQLHPNRRLLYHPLLVFTVIFINFFKALLTTYIKIRNNKLSKLWYICLGDLDYLYNTGYSVNVLFILISS